MAGRHRCVAAPPGFRRATSVARAPKLPLAIQMMDGYSNVTHHVTDEAMADGRRAGGRYRAIWSAGFRYEFDHAGLAAVPNARNVGIACDRTWCGWSRGRR